MIVGTRKSLEELQEMLSGYKKILLSGCDTCVAECASGGRREVSELAAALQLAFQLAGKEVELKESSVDRQCIHEFLLDVVDLAQDYDAVLSLACGAGVQALAAKLEKIPVFPALNTLFHRRDGRTGTLAGELPGLRRLPARLYRWYLPHFPVCQTAAQRTLRRRQQWPVRN